MTTGPRVWHYRLVAELWTKFNLEVPELSHFRGQIGRFGQPVLDLGCGTGRVMLPLLAAGIEIDGCDVSEDMLYWCRERAKREGLTPAL
jgi:ubiquinone/menaquinone biosynthesis C-methylase UbiE